MDRSPSTEPPSLELVPPRAPRPSLDAASLVLPPPPAGASRPPPTAPSARGVGRGIVPGYGVLRLSHGGELLGRQGSLEHLPRLVDGQPVRGHLRAHLVLEQELAPDGPLALEQAADLRDARDADGDASAEVDEGAMGRDGSRGEERPARERGEGRRGYQRAEYLAKLLGDDRRARCPRAHRRDGGTWGRERRERG